MLQMAKPTTSLRRAVDYLKEEGVINNDNDLLEVFEIDSPGALSAYINGKPSKKGLAAFKKKYGEKVSKFFETEVAQDQSGNAGFIPATEVIADLKADKERYIKIIETNLASIQTTLAKLAEFNSGESQKNNRRPPGARGGRRFQE